MSKIQYFQLANVSIFHSYYQSGIFRDVRIIPDSRTQTFMWNSGLLLRQFENGFSVLNAGSFSGSYVRELINFFNGFYLRFQVFSTKQEFIQITDTPVNKLVYFKFTSNKVKEMELIPELIPAGPSSPIAIVDLHLDDFLSSENTLQRQAYSIRFSARPLQWNYYVITRANEFNENLVVVDQKGTQFQGPDKVILSNGVTSHRFSSETDLFPIEEYPNSFFGLKTKMSGGDDDEFLIDHLPAPTPITVTVSENPDAELACSNMYVYL